MADLVTLTIDGVQVSVPKETLIVDAAKRVHKDVPVFCYHPKLEPVGMCRMCLVEIGRVQRDRATGEIVRDDQGQPRVAFGPKLETACTTLVEEGMVVVGENSKVKEARDDVIEFLLTSHPLDCPICDKGGECPLQDLTMRHGPGESRFLFSEKLHLAKRVPLGQPDDALIYLDRERCIQCARCTRFQEEVADDPVIGFYERGRKLEIVTFSEPGFDSKWSGNTTDICPVGALTTRDFRFGARPWEMIPAASICPHCPVGCNLTFSTRREAAAGGAHVVKRVMPRQNEAVNEIWICDKGRFGYHFAASPERLTRPLLRKDGALREAAWDEALTLVAEKFEAAGSGLAGLLGGRLSNEDLYAIRTVVTELGGQVELNSQMGGGDRVQLVGVGVGTNFSSMSQGTAILVVASDLEEEAPVWWLRVKQAAERGATLIAAHGRPTKTDRRAAYTVRYEYGHEAATVLGMLVAGSSEAADAFARAENGVILFGREGLDFAGSSALAQACANLLIATNHYGRPNNGLIAVWPHANTQGAWDMGVKARDLNEPMPGVTASWIVAADPVGDGLVGADDLRKSGFVAVQELFLTETAKAADVVLPAAAWTEREGTFTNGERRVQRFYPAVPPRGKPDFQIAAEIGAKVGVKLPRHASLVMLEIAKDVPAYAGITYQGLARVEPQWPEIGGQDFYGKVNYYGGTAYENEQGLGVQLKSGAERGEAVAMGKVEAHEPERDGLTLVATTVLYDRGATFTPSKLMRPRLPQPYIELNAVDAAKWGVKDGDAVIVSADGMTAKVTTRVAERGRAPEGVALMPASLGPAVPVRPTRVTISKT
ncbi:MAG TPA: NADH-quinone oxidoreductase subunit NuoG [Anaerolineales bacterium]|nr:NADH-quinone oxidoreductase subunit NuoG [Anaerolineales bacterium]